MACRYETGGGGLAGAVRPQPCLDDRAFRLDRPKRPGGTSATGFPVYLRGAAAGFDRWAREHGCHGWRFADLLPVFRRSEDNERLAGPLHGTGGLLGIGDPPAPPPLAYAFLRAAQQFGMPYCADFNARDARGCGLHQLMRRGTDALSTAAAFLSPVLGRENLRVETGSEAVGVVLEQGRARGVRCRRQGQEWLALAERGVVLAAGPIGTPRLLMLSGIGPAWHLNALGVRPVHDLPGVGEGLADHLLLPVAGQLSEDAGDALPAHMATAPTAAGALWDSADAAGLPDHGFRLVLPAGGRQLRLDAFHLHPRSRGTIRLQSADPGHPPLVDPRLWTVAADRAPALEALRIAREILRQPALADHLAREELPGPGVRTEEEYLGYAAARARPANRPVGGCRMGGDAGAPVDPTLRLRGTEGLWVCDGSVMPDPVSAEPLAATIMIAERGADFIRTAKARPVPADGNQPAPLAETAAR